MADRQQAPLAIHDSLSAEMTQAFIPEGPRPLAILSFRDSPRLPLALVTGQGSGPNAPGGFLRSRRLSYLSVRQESSFPCTGSVTQLPR